MRINSYHMSRKTRQEKIIADLRRKLEMTRKGKEWVMSSESNREGEHEKKTERFIPITHPRPITQNSPQISTSYLKSDLTKTFILTILAISLEIVLYFLLRVGKF